jgi:hypothetical protein
MGSKKKKEEELFEKKVSEIASRLTRERLDEPRWKVKIVLVPSRPGQEGVSVKVSVAILDKSFYCRAINILFSAGTAEYQTVDMHKIDMDNFEVVLEKIPEEVRIMFYMKMLDKSGEWITDDNQGKFFTFTAEPGGKITFDSEWEDKRLIPCHVCGYECRIEWDECPSCNTPLHDTSQSIFADEQKAKEDARRQVKEDESWKWEEAQSTDEVWRGLPECPSCGSAVQPEWKKCPICGFDLTSVKLQKKDIYADDKDVQEL